MKNKVTLLSAAVTAALAAPAFAGINDIIISEYVEGSSYNKAVELTNTGSNDFTFPANIELVRQRNGSETWDTVHKIEGITIPAGKSLVLHHPKPSSNDTNLLDTLKTNKDKYGAVIQPTNTYAHTGNDTIVLQDVTDANSPAILDIIGVKDSSNDWGKDVTLRRLATAEAPKATYDPKDWLAEAKNTFSGLGDPTLAVKSTTPIQPCTDAAGTLEEITIGQIQGSGYRSPLLTDGKFTSDDEYLVTGVVTAVTTSLEKGFYLQAADGDENTSDAVFVKTEAPQVNSDLIGQEVCVRGYVKENYGMTTVLATNNEWEVINESAGIPDTTDLLRIPADGDNFRATLERHEGMLVRLPDDMDPGTTDIKEDMRVSRSFSFDYDSYRNNMVLAFKRPNMQPNQEHIAGSKESHAQASQNKNYRLYVDSDAKAPNGQIPYYPDFSSAPADNYIRINDSVIGLEGVIYYSHGEFRLIPTNTVDNSNFKHNTPRTSSPKLNDETTYDQFAIRIATQNVLNFFNSPFGGSENTHGDNRGAESSYEFEKQKAKIVEAIYGLDADIIGLMEIENNGFGDFSAITELVNAVNAKYTDERYSSRNSKKSIHNQYAFVGFDSDGNTIIDEFDSVGSDAITSGLLYRPSKVSLEYSKIIPMPSQQAPMITDENGAAIVNSKGEVRESGKNYQRNTVAANFLVHNTGKELTVSVNHLKSKGSTCWEDWKGWETWKDFETSKDDVKNDDYQGSCENFRVAAAVQLGEEMAKMGGDQVVMGDMNSYAMEDPMLVMTKLPKGKIVEAAGYTYIEKMPQFGPEGKTITKAYGFLNAVSMMDEANNRTSWSYSYNDEIGSLDHILITPSLEKKVLDATDWHINAAESPLYDYSDKYKSKDHNFYSEDPYRSSDHDSAIIALSYGYGETDGKPVMLSSKSGRIEVAYPIPATTTAVEGDVAEISFSPAPADMSKVALPRIELTKDDLAEDGKKTVFFDVNGIEPGEYTMTMKLVRPTTTKSATAGTVVPNSTVTMKVEVAKRDSLSPKVTAEPYDGSGGSFGIFGLLSMLGLGFLRRCKK